MEGHQPLHPIHHQISEHATMSHHPYKPFNDAVRNIKRQKALEQPEKIRDRDNAASAPKPPSFGYVGRSNAAPRGHTGIKRGLRTPEAQKAKQFDIKAPGAVTREFKSIVTPSKGKGHDRDR